MAGPRSLPVFALVLLPLLLAGCVECPTGPPVTARGIGEGVDDEAGLLGFTLTVRVTDGPGGAPVPDAGVVAYWARDRPVDWDGEVRVRSDGDSATVVVDPGELRTTPEARDSHRLRTNAQGEVRVRVPSDRVIGLVAAAPGFTEEWVPAMATGSGSESGTVVLPLYRERLNYTLEDSWGPGGASTGFVTSGDYLWKPTELAFGDTEDARSGYVARLARLDVRVEWTNGATAYGDLGLGLGPEPEQPTHFEDDSADTAPGDHAEEASLEAVRLREVGVLGATRAYVGPASANGYLAPFGLPYRLTVDATFDTALAKRTACSVAVRDDDDGTPGASVPLATLAPLAALALAAVLGRRRLA